MNKCFLFIFGLLLSANAIGQNKGAEHPHIKHYQEQIGLDDAQVEQVKSIYAASEVELVAVSEELKTVRMSNTETYKSATDQERKAVDARLAELSAKRKELETARKQAVQNLLNDEQKAIWKEKYEIETKPRVKKN